MKKRILSFALALCLCLSLMTNVMFAAHELQGKTAIIYTSNIRGDIDMLPKIATLKGQYEALGADVILADLGNFLQGTVYSTYDSGKTVIGLMDAAGYDVVAVGRHEFDFGTGIIGTEQHEILYTDGSVGSLLSAASFEVLSANVLKDGAPAFTPNTRVKTASGIEVGFFGLTNTDTPKYVLESNMAGFTFEAPSAVIPAQAAALEGCDVIIALGNNSSSDAAPGVCTLFMGEGAGPQVGVAIIDNTTKKVETNGAVSVASVTGDAAVLAAVNAQKAIINAEYPENAVAKSEVTLVGSQAASRSGETNLGDLWADALLWFARKGGIASFYDEDEIAAGNNGIQVNENKIVAVWNGGNLRDYINTGDVTMKDIKRVLPYPNRVAVVYLSGAQLLELLEAATQALPYTGESADAAASFPHVAGIKYTLSSGTPYDKGEAYGKHWFKANSIRRVSIESINGAPFDMNATYAVITSNAVANGMDSNYICLEKDIDLSTITSAAVTDVVWRYITEELGGVIGEQYATADGRIAIDNTAAAPIYSDVAFDAWYYDEVKYVTDNNLMNGVGDGIFAPNGDMTRAMFVTMLYRLSGEPSVTGNTPFNDLTQGWYRDAVLWAVEQGITKGVSDTAFAPDQKMTRAEMATFICRYYNDEVTDADVNYTDRASIPDWALDGVIYCTINGIMGGVSETEFAPNSTANRAMGATVLMRMDKRG